MNIDKPAKVIWDYMQMHANLKPVDAIFVLCSTDVRVADRAAELYKQGYAPKVIVSGGSGKLSKHSFTRPEARIFADRLIEAGVPEDVIIIEDRASNSGENIRFTFDLLIERNIVCSSFILVHKPYMERRTHATFKKQWPDTDAEIILTSPEIGYEDYFTEELPKDLVVNIMVGDLQRIGEYPALGFQIEQVIPPEVQLAYEQLVDAGYTKHLIKRS